MLDLKLNCVGMVCPKPLLETKKFLKTMQSGQVVEVFASDLDAIYDLKALCQQTGHLFLSSQVLNSGVVCRIQHK